jgi:hypothetical protein
MPRPKAGDIKPRSNFDLSTTSFVERLVGGKTHGRHRISHRV